MPIASLRRKTLLILIVTVLAAPEFSVAGLQPEHSRSLKPTEGASLELFDRIWNFLQKVQAKEGCNIDPNGCTPQDPRSQPKEGCRIDPNGHCLP
jgi:hypothetical protein